MRNNYVSGNNAVKIDAKAAINAAPKYSELNRIKAEEKKKSRMSVTFMYVAFIAVVLTIFSVVIIDYLKLYNEITTINEKNTVYADQVQELRLANDDEMAKIDSGVDLDEVRRIAIEDLGMVYADESQVIKYKKENSDYVRQFADIPE